MRPFVTNQITLRGFLILKEGFEIRFIKDANADDLIRLYKEARWVPAEASDADAYLSIVRNTFLFAGVFHEGKMIGMGRAISDGVSDAYIQDVTVLPAYRGLGLGGKIILSLVEELKKYNIGWIGLIAEPNTKEFYEKLGFNEMKAFTPMLYKAIES